MTLINGDLDFSAPASEDEAEAERKPTGDKVLDQLMSRIGKPEHATRYLKVMVYGEPGVGKTVFAATFPRALVIDVERGAYSINNHPNLQADIFEYKSIRQVEALLKYVAKGDSAFDQYDSIVLDSISELQKRDLDDIVNGEGRTASLKDTVVPQLQDFNVSTEHLRRIMYQLKDLDKNIVVTCHAKQDKDETTGRIVTRPNLTPKLSSSLVGVFDLVGYMSAKGTDDRTYMLQVHPTLNVVAKTRLGNLPTVIENPSYDSLVK